MVDFKSREVGKGANEKDWGHMKVSSSLEKVHFEKGTS